MHSIHLSHKQKAVKVLVFLNMTLYNLIGTKLHGVTAENQNLIKEGDLTAVYLLSPQLAFFFPFSRWQYRIQNLFCLPAVVSSKLGRF